MEGTTVMPMQPDAEFGITEAGRILGEVFAPWVQDLGLSVERIELAQPADAPDWQLTLSAPEREPEPAPRPAHAPAAPGA